MFDDTALSRTRSPIAPLTSPSPVHETAVTRITTASGAYALAGTCTSRIRHPATKATNAPARMVHSGLQPWSATRIAVVYTPIFARVVRGPVLALKEREFVEASRALGAPAGRIVGRHILPNLASILVVQTSIALSWAILTEASLSFLGLSAQPPTPSWGAMLNEGRQNLELAPHLAVFPGLAIMLAVLGFNLLGDGLRDALDPRKRS